MKPYDVRLHQLRGFAGAVRSAQAILKCIAGLGPGDRQDQEQGAGRLLDALDAAGDRRGARCARLCARAGRDRAQRRRRQPDLPARVQADADRRQLPGLARLAADGHGRRGHHDGLRALRAAPEPPDQPGAERRAAGLPDQGRRHVLRHDAQPVHGRHADRRAAHPLDAGLASSRSRPRPTRRTSSRWA